MIPAAPNVEPLLHRAIRNAPENLIVTVATYFPAADANRGAKGIHKVELHDAQAILEVHHGPGHTPDHRRGGLGMKPVGLVRTRAQRNLGCYLISNAAGIG